jgi:GNAT superfamily N-acetyltransferase
LTDEVIIRELNGLDEMLAVYPLFRQSNSHLSEAAFRERLSAMHAQGNYRCIAAYIGERPVGLSGLWTGNQLWCGKYIEADHVVVDTTLRSLGIGARLMAWIEAEGERTGCSVFRIAMVLGKERTHQFYVRNGFFDDGLLMVKALSRGAEEFPEYVSRSAGSGLGA